MMRKIILFIVVLGLSVLNLQAQDPHFSQFYTAPLAQNPALAGAVYDLQVNINYKNQWSTVANPFTTAAASFDTKFIKRKIKKGYWAGGLSFFKDDAGVSKLRTVLVNFTGAYHVKLDEYNTFGGGLQAGVGQRSINFNELQWGSQYNGSVYDPGINSGEPTGMDTRFYPDAAIGVVWSHANNTGAVDVSNTDFFKWNLGASVYHLTMPNLSFTGMEDPLNMKFVFHGDGLISIPNNPIAFAPGFMFYKQGPATEIYYGGLVRYHLKHNSKYTGFAKGAAISGGAYHRWGDAFAIVGQLDFSGTKIGFSYDLNSSDLRTATKGLGGFEVSISYVMYNPFKNSRRR